MRRGSRLHDVLAEFHRRWPHGQEEPPRPAGDDAQAFIEQFQQIIDERLVTPRAGIEAALLELDRRQLRKWAERHRDHHAQYASRWSELDGGFVPTHFELRFGPARPGDAGADDPRSCDEAFTIMIGGQSVRITGRIDRIDVARLGGRVVFNVIDYKSGRRASLKEEHIASGEHLQLPIYMAAAQALVFGGEAEPLAAGYWTMDRGFDAKGVLAAQLSAGGGEWWEKTWRVVEERIGQFIAAMRRGEFPVYSLDEHCTSGCDFNTICRVAQVRSLGKTWPPTE
jgi:ATP-dependent helicase/DNAse subunit B